jgi:hypothetical protein
VASLGRDAARISEELGMATERLASQDRQIATHGLRLELIGLLMVFGGLVCSGID